MTCVVRVENLCKSFPEGDTQRLVLDNISFEIHTGECVALVGPSGSGKTTLLNLLSGLILPDSGSVLFYIDREAVRVETQSSKMRTRMRRAHISTIYQFFNLIPTLTVEENVLLPLELNGLLEHRAAALEPLHALHLSDRLAAFPEVLSGGEQQRIAVVRALAHRPKLVLADEPTGNLDADNAAQVVDLLWERVASAEASLVVATHNLNIAEKADKVISLVP